MRNLVGFLWRLLVSEISHKSRRPGPGGDTLLKCVLSVAALCAFYLWVYNFNYDTPNPRKMEWHRILAAGLVGVGIVAVAGEYLVSFSRRARDAWREYERAT
ncbi:MAG: hypothetical protein EON56_03885 [Alphaproteobacteria bacterium]|nr:MAG: hypothetical protein EON56_03885 [Alphaproteobacteria bacterium]